jgi:hypothetical protein
VLIQTTSQIVNVSEWNTDEHSDPFPQGARSKKVVQCPINTPHPFLIPGHRYLFKQSNENFPEQYWAEIIAYRVGCLVGVEVPPAFIAYDNEDGHAALIEWFYDWGGTDVKYVAGGDYMERLIPEFDRRRGQKHNIETVIRFGKAHQNAGLLMDTVEHWAKMLTFDAMIGNTDRHQDNWGVVFTFDDGILCASFSPAFDNGTSLGHEILDRKLQNFRADNQVEAYIKRGTHHLKWSMREQEPVGHVGLVVRFVEEHPETKKAVQSCLGGKIDEIEKMVLPLCEFDVGTALAPERADFIIRLLFARINRLRDALGL